jgi:peptidoglycan/LPS O-acetylase OafA/YrhL
MTRGQRGDGRFRPDLEGLRGIAILLVLLCHVEIPGAEAGFVGVDVFFVLSGFLITGLLVDEAERTGRIGLGAFYARRARRILPAAIVVLASTLLAAQLVLSPLDLPRVADDALAASLSLANVRFALDATDYFAPVNASPMLHFWSLAVEEQFYLFWPVLLLIATRLGRPRVAMGVVAVAILAGSFVLCYALTATSEPWAYYSLPTRAWQLAAGGLVAVSARWVSRAPRRLALATGWVGVILLGASLGVIQETSAYPGLVSLFPTLGALAIIASGGQVASPLRTGLSWTPLRWLGRISYSVYLWHWPILVLGPVALGLTDSDEGAIGADLPVRLGLVAVAIGLAALTWWMVEEPFRRGRLSHPGRKRGLALAGAAVAVVLVGSTTMGAVAERDLGTVAAADVDIELALADPSDTWPALTMPLPMSSPAVAPPSGAPRPDPTDSDRPRATPTTPSTPAPPPQPSPRVDGRVPRDLQPSLGAARDDHDPLIADGCGLSLAGTEPPVCEYGDPHGSVTVALVGDSHATNWFPAFERLARHRGWRLIPFTKFSCVFVDMPIWSPHLEREYTECEAWREQVIGQLARIKPDLTVVASNQWFPVVVDHDSEPERQGKAMARLIKRLPGSVAIMVDTPRSDVDVPACLAKYRKAIEHCTTSQAAAFGWRHLRRETEAARITGATIVDLSDAICPSDPCAPIIGTTLVYRDHHHLTATFAASLARVLEAALPPIGVEAGS